MKEKIGNTKAPLPKQTFSSEQLDKALFAVDFLMSQMLCENEYLLLGDTGRCANEGKPLEGDKIEVGLEKRYFNPFAKSSFGYYVKNWLEEKPDVRTFELEGVPVELKLINRNYHFFRNPNAKNYQYDDYQLPNPFATYWKARFLIR